MQQYDFLHDNYFLVRKSYLLHILFNLKTIWDFRLVLKFSILSYTWVHFDWYRYKVRVTIQEKHYRLVERQLSSVSLCIWSEVNFQIKMCIFFCFLTESSTWQVSGSSEVSRWLEEATALRSEWCATGCCVLVQIKALFQTWTLFSEIEKV